QQKVPPPSIAVRTSTQQNERKTNEKKYIK
ncbi:unnamed protein product, partial [Rotaria sp. Silwood1]